MSNQPITVIKFCPLCGRAMIERTNTTNGSAFIGCTGYPDCRHTEPLPESVKLRRQGQRGMFDDEVTK
jgi:DNA topoisomerase I